MPANRPNNPRFHRKTKIQPAAVANITMAIKGTRSPNHHHPTNTDHKGDK